MNKFTDVNEFLDSLGQTQREQVVYMRQLIVDVHPELIEHIKWNSPSYVLDGEDRITFSVRSGFPVSLVLHMGATRPEDKSAEPIMKDESGLIEWKSDIRGIVSFKNKEDAQTKSAALSEIIRKWLALPSS